MTQNYSCSLSMVSSKQICQRPKDYFFYLSRFINQLVCLIIVSLVMALGQARAQTFVVGCWMQEGSAADLGLQALYGQALEILGFDLEWRHLPVARAQLEMAQGLLDADCARHDQYSLQLLDGQQVIRLPVVVGGSTVDLWQAKDADHQIENLTQAAEQQLRLVYQRGTDIARRHLQDYPQHLVYEVGSSCVALRMLEAKRVDILLSTVGDYSFKVIEHQDCPLPQKLVEIHRFEAVPILHPRHQVLTQSLAEVLGQLLDETRNTQIESE